nr:cell division protein ZapA [uncultured Ruminococcus sp.]
MENNKIKVTVFVAGQRFNIITDKSEKYVRDIADEIDARINSLVVSQEMTRERAAVLTALDYADDSELDKENISAVKEQMKDYLKEIERLQDNNAKIIRDYNSLKAEYERLIEQNRSAEDCQKALEESEKKVAELQEENGQLKQKIESLKEQSATVVDPDISEEIPLPEEPPVEEEEKITAEDDLFFDDTEDEEQVKPEKKKKNRHNHSHVNPYQQKAKQKEQGYTQQRQYTFFDIDEQESD